MRHEFPSQWHRFLQGSASDGKATLELPVTNEMFPFITKGKEIRTSKLGFFVKCVGDVSATLMEAAFGRTAAATTTTTRLTHVPSDPVGWLGSEPIIVDDAIGDEPMPWRLSLPAAALDAGIEDIYLRVCYKLNDLR
jgi:hypothetical protein